jgi:hypothetical protein
MKNTLTLLCLFLCNVCNSQITLEFQTPNYFLFNMKLSNSESKYFERNFVKINSLNQVTLYNLDGSLFKSIQLPQKPDTLSYIIEINFFSKALFDNDSTNLEFLVLYACDSILSGASSRVKIVREDGTILLDEANASPDFGTDYNFGVIKTEQGSKLILYYTYQTTTWPYQTKVFNLPGELPTNTEEKSNTVMSSLLLYPNPNNGSFFIKIRSNDSNNHQIELFSTNGKLIDTYKSSGTTTHINNYGLSDGVYLIKSNSNGLNSTTKMIIRK